MTCCTTRSGTLTWRPAFLDVSLKGQTIVSMSLPLRDKLPTYISIIKKHTGFRYYRDDDYLKPRMDVFKHMLAATYALETIVYVKTTQGLIMEDLN